MGLHTFTSTSLEALSKKLAEQINNSRTNILQKDFVITPSNGLDNWIKVQVAEQNGIAANIQFVTITKMAEIIYKVLAGKMNRKEALSKLQMQWILFELMGTEEFKEKFVDKAIYFESNPQKRLALAGKVSELFTNYQSIIPDTLLQWNNPENTEKDLENWQKYLWLKLKKKTKEDFITSLDSFEFISKKLKETEFQETLKAKLPVIYLFNLNEINKAHLDLLIEIGNYIDLNMFFFAPIQGNEEIKNSLLKSWVGSQKLLLDYLRERDVNIENRVSENANSVETLLGKIQNDILNNKTKQDSNNINDGDLKDGSIVINSCYTPTREVEVLYNYLVHHLNNNSSIGARDIAVICTDIPKYSAAIKSVFETAPYKLPYHVLDYPVQDNNSPLMALEALLNIDPRWFKPEQVMHLLEFPSVRNKFEIKDVSMLRTLVNKANIRNGFVGKMQDNETHLISWEHGLNRLFLGYCMGGNEAYEYENGTYLLVDETEGSSAYDLIRLRHFINCVKDTLIKLGGDKTLFDWIEFMKETISLFISIDGENIQQMGQLDRELANLVSLNTASQEEIPFNTFYSSLKDIIAGISNDERILRKGITFCSTKPSRSVPFKIIAMLGLNYDSFPRKYNTLSFDLTNETPEGKMNSCKERDKFFFLETLLFAKEKLYLSFIGHNAKNNAKLPPSLLVDELIDYMVPGYSEKTIPIIEHPLHSFDTKYFNGDNSTFYSYLGKNEVDRNPDFFKEHEPADKKELKEIPTYKFVNFLKDPFKYYYNNCLGIYYSDEEELLSDEELFDLDKLQQWGIKTQLVESDELIKEDSTKRLALVEMGKLPLANPGKIIISEMDEEIETLRSTFLNQIDGKREEKVKIDFEIDEVRVYGQIDNIYGNDFIFNNLSISSEIKNKIEAYLCFLLLHKADKNKNLVFNYINGSFFSISAGTITIEQRDEILRKLTAMLKVGSGNITPFTVDLLEKTVFDTLTNVDEEKITKLIDKTFGNKPFLSTYIKKEWEAGYFEKQENQTELLNNLAFINQSILQKF